MIQGTYILLPPRPRINIFKPCDPQKIFFFSRSCTYFLSLFCCSIFTFHLLELYCEPDNEGTARTGSGLEAGRAAYPSIQWHEFWFLTQLSQVAKTAITYLKSLLGAVRQRETPACFASESTLLNLCHYFKNFFWDLNPYVCSPSPRI